MLTQFVVFVAGDGFVIFKSVRFISRNKWENGLHVVAGPVPSVSDT